MLNIFNGEITKAITDLAQKLDKAIEGVKGSDQKINIPVYRFDTCVLF